MSSLLEPLVDGSVVDVATTAEMAGPDEFADGEEAGLVAVVAGVGAPDALAAVREVASWPRGAVVVIFADYFLGGGSGSSSEVEASGAALATVRSLAVERGARVRMNGLAVPGHVLGHARAPQRGPLRREVEVSDIALTSAFLLSRRARYVTGQTLFLNAGRQLFSSLSA